MTNPVTQSAYLVASGTGTIYPTVFFPRAPTSNDLSFPISQRWIDTSSSIGVSITGATNSNPAVLTAGNEFTVGQIIFISGVGGMTELNNRFFTITAVTGSTFTIGVDSTSFGVYTSGGTATAQVPLEYILLSLFTRNGFLEANWALLGEASTLSPSDDLRPVARYVVSNFPGFTGFTSIQAAINQAVADGATTANPALVWLWEGTYNESLSLAAGVYLASGANVGTKIIGNATFAVAANNDEFQATQVTFETPGSGGAAFSLTGAFSGLVHFDHVIVNGNFGSALFGSSPGSSFNIFDSQIGARPGFKVLDIVDLKNIFEFGSVHGASDTASTIAGAASIVIFGGLTMDAFVLSGTSQVALVSGAILAPGTLECFNIGAGCMALLGNSIVISSAASGFWATGIGGIIYNAITATFGSATQVDPALGTLAQTLEVGNLSFDGGISSIVSDGELIIGNTGGRPTINTLTAGTGITITNGPGTITISNSAVPALSINVQTFTGSGTYTPTAGMTFCTIEGWGAGGGGGGVSANVTLFSSAAGGGAGGYSRTTASAATIGGSQVVTIGTAGTGGPAGNNNGTAGTATSVGIICIANGGGGGSGNSGANGVPGAAGGTAGTGDIAAPGQGGGSSLSAATTTTTTGISGAGGSTLLGSGGIAITAGSGNGNVGTGFGTGGSGANITNSTAAGGDGTGGFVIITEYIT